MFESMEKLTGNWLCQLVTSRELFEPPGTRYHMSVSLCVFSLSRKDFQFNKHCVTVRAAENPKTELSRNLSKSL